LKKEVEMMANRSRGIQLFISILISLLIGAGALSTAQVVYQVTDEKTSLAGPPALDDAGAAVYTGSSNDSDGGNPDHTFQILRIDPETLVVTPLTSAADGTTVLVSVSDDGQWIAFPSPSDLTGENHDQSIELFVMSSDGLQITQLTNDPAPNAGSVTGAAMSGNGERILFLANTNPLGTNPDHEEQLFIINRDGSGLAQLTQATSGSFGLFSISDDGTRIVFAQSGDLTGGNPDLSSELFAINSDGTNLRQLTTTTADYSSGGPALSGNGQKITFQSNEDLTGNNLDHWDEIFIMDWDGTNLQQLTKTTIILGITGDPASQSPSITDDGQTVVFHSNHSRLFPPLNIDGNYEIFRIGSDGTGLTALTGTFLEAGSFMPVIAGGGGRIGYYAIDLADVHLKAMDGAGGTERDLLTFDIVMIAQPGLSPDGTRAIFVRSTGLLGGGQIWRIESDGSHLTQVTNLSSGSPAGPSIAGDRETIVFSADSNPAGNNLDLSEEIFTIQADGTGIRQLTNGTSDTSSRNPVISNDGSVIFFDSDADLTGGNSDLSREIFKINIDGLGLQQLTNAAVGTVSAHPRADATGTWIVFESNADLDGGNPDGTYEIYRIAANGSGLQRITGDPVLDSRRPDISNSGELIVFDTSADPLGTNPNGNNQVLFYNVTSASLHQVTFYSEGDSAGARIGGDGTWIYFSSNAPVFENDPDAPSDLYRILPTGVGIERVGALRAGFAGGIGAISFLTGGGSLQADDSGDVTVFIGFGDLTEANPDLLSEVWFIDRNASTEIFVSNETPTVLSWAHESGPLRYDVIRGDLSLVGPGGDGIIDLGPVVCLEDDSPDADTIGFEDDFEPAPGQVLFYLYRGSQGLLDGPGSYGQSSDGLERQPSGGGCAE
jgi:Tol biopolymer transport system component